MKRALLFDFDGTIADTFDLAMRIANKLAQEFGLRPLSNLEIAHFRNATIREAVRALNIPVRKMPAMLLRMRQELHENIELMRPFPGIVAVLKELWLQSDTMGIVTANSEENVRWFLKKHDIDFFDFGAYSSALLGKVSKIRGMIHRHGLEREGIIYFGDTIGDIEASRKAGIKVAAVTWGYNSKEALEEAGPDFLVNRPEEIIECVASAETGTGSGRK